MDSQSRTADTKEDSLDQMMATYRKLITLGVLVNGFAHDLNNTLTGIMGSLELYTMNLPEGEATNTYLARIERFTDRLAAQTRLMLTCSRQGKPDPAPVSLSQVVRSTLALIKNRLPATMNIEYTGGQDLPAVALDTPQVVLLLEALLLNAGEATGGTGTVRIATGCETVEEDTPHPRLPRPGKYVSLTIADDGPGMAEEVLSQIFNPLFTTKTDDGGMSLAAVQAVVQNHRGQIYIDSQVDQGTTVWIYFLALD